MIEPICKTKLYETVAKEITEMVRSDQWAPGMKLPIESDLAGMFCVGRSTVREAMKSLQMAGILTSKTGMGTFVAEGARTIIQNGELVALLSNRAYLSDLAETRYVIEPKLAALAAKNGSDARLRGLYEIIAAMEGSDTKEQLMELGFRFHTALAEMSGNRVLTGFYASIAAQLLRMRTLDFLTLEVYKRGTGEHLAILRAVEVRDEKEAERLMRCHLEQDYHQYLENE